MIEKAKSVFDFVKKYALLEERIENLERKLKEVEDKYQKGWTPQNICESCYEGRYINKGGCNYVCESCGKEAPLTWKRKHHK